MNYDAIMNFVRNPPLDVATLTEEQLKIADYVIRQDIPCAGKRADFPLTEFILRNFTFKEALEKNQYIIDSMESIRSKYKPVCSWLIYFRHVDNCLYNNKDYKNFRRDFCRKPGNAVLSKTRQVTDEERKYFLMQLGLVVGTGLTMCKCNKNFEEPLTQPCTGLEMISVAEYLNFIAYFNRWVISKPKNQVL